MHMTRPQQTLMRFDPATGDANPYPSHAAQWRDYHGKATAWLFNPWVGCRRTAGDVGSDPFGLLILSPGEPVVAARDVVQVRPTRQDLFDAVVDLIELLERGAWRETSSGPGREGDHSIPAESR